MRSLLLTTGFALCALGCQHPSAAGKYRFVERSKGASGLPYAGWITLTLSGNGRMSFDSGDLTLALGSWKESNGIVTLSNLRSEIFNDPIAMQYRIADRNLIPQEDGQDIPSWRFAESEVDREF